MIILILDVNLIWMFSPAYWSASDQYKGIKVWVPISFLFDCWFLVKEYKNKSKSNKCQMNIDQTTKDINKFLSNYFKKDSFFLYKPFLYFAFF